MNPAYALLKALVSRGSVLTLTPKGSGTYNTSTGTFTPSSGSSVDFYGYLANYTLEELNNNLIEAGSKKVVIPNVDTSGTTMPDIHVGDKILTPEGVFEVKLVTPTYDKGLPIFYICQLGK